MESDQYIYPGELAALLAFLIFPPLLLALGLQLPFLLRRGVSGGKACLSLLTTTTISIAITLILSIFAGGVLPPSFGLQDVKVGGHHIPILPLAFAVVAAVAVFVSSWIERRRA